MAHADIPAPRGLYDPSLEKDACGVGFIAELDGVPKREVVALGIEMLIRLKHRGACGCESNTGVPVLRFRWGLEGGQVSANC